MANSIMQDNKECYITGETYNLHEHHIFMGNPKRMISEKCGLKVYLKAELHNQSEYGVHGKYGHSLDLILKHKAQVAYMELGYSVEQFRELMGKSNLLTDEEYNEHMQVVNDNVRLL